MNAKFKKKLIFHSRKQNLSIVPLNSYFYNAKQLFYKTTLLNPVVSIAWVKSGMVQMGSRPQTISPRPWDLHTPVYLLLSIEQL